MEPDYKWIAQDADGVIAKYVQEPEIIGNHWRKGKYKEYKTVQIGEANPNWRDSLIDLSEYPYSIIDGILVHGDIKKVRLTDTELLDAIVKHELFVGIATNGMVEIINEDGFGIYNKKGNIRKAIKKWLRKNT
jgi:hypothetical protein